MNIISPYRNIKQYTRISVEAYHMYSDIKNNMKIILKKKLEKKCNKNGFIDEIYKILEYSDGIMPPENLNGVTIYNIAYNCKLCIPIENTVIIGHIRVTNQELIVSINGPIMIFIPKENVDTSIWNIIDGYTNKVKKTKLVSGDYVKIQIIDKRINQNDSQIKAIGKLLDFATSEEVDKYFGSKIISEENSINTKPDNSLDNLSLINSVNSENLDETINSDNIPNTELDTNFII
jgi:DNA-directed RNA polymerase subunit E'/Rpb7